MPYKAPNYWGFIRTAHKLLSDPLKHEVGGTPIEKETYMHVQLKKGKAIRGCIGCYSGVLP
jgi:hypothetical protein